MPRIARKNSNSNFYHIIVQGINKKYIFNKTEFINKYIQIIIDKKEKSNVTILAYCDTWCKKRNRCNINRISWDIRFI